MRQTGTMKMSSILLIVWIKWFGATGDIVILVFFVNLEIFSFPHQPISLLHKMFYNKIL